MRPASRCGQAFLSPQGKLFVVVSDPWIHPWLSEENWLHDVVVFPPGLQFRRHESSMTELVTRLGWTRLA